MILVTKTSESISFNSTTPERSTTIYYISSILIMIGELDTAPSCLAEAGYLYLYLYLSSTTSFSPRRGVEYFDTLLRLVFIIVCDWKAMAFEAGVENETVSEGWESLDAVTKEKKEEAALFFRDNKKTRAESERRVKE